MKKILRSALLLTFSLVTANLIWSNLEFQSIPWTIIKVAIILAIFEILLKPIIKVILFPINLLTLGLFRAVINTLGLYLASFLFTDFYVRSINSPPTNFFGIQIPALSFSSFWNYLVTSTTISLIFYIFNLIITKKPKK
jgi:putative membrane protein